MHTEPQPAAESQPAAPPAVVPRMSVLMFLQHFALGLWVVTVGTYIGENTGASGAAVFSAAFIGLAATSSAFGSLVSPFFVGIVADRYIAPRKLLSVLHLGCALCLVGMCVAESQSVFYLAMLAYFQLSSPTFSVSTAVALRQLPNEQTQFPVVRAFGTVGWVVSGILIGAIWPLATTRSIEGTVVPMGAGAAAHVLLTLYCLTLPPTEKLGSAGAGWRSLAGGASLWRNRSFLIFMAISALAAAPAQFYNFFANPFLNHIQQPYPAALLTIGQVVEVGCLVALPVLMVRVGVKRLFLLGAGAWVFRYVLLAYTGESTGWFVYPAILVHGACYAFVYMTGQLYADQIADRDARAAAQGLHAIVTTGIGHLAGALLSGWAQAKYLTPPGVEDAPYDYRSFWLLAASISGLAIVLFALFFREPKGGTRDDDLSASAVTNAAASAPAG